MTETPKLPSFEEWQAAQAKSLEQCRRNNCPMYLEPVELREQRLAYALTQVAWLIYDQAPDAIGALLYDMPKYLARVLNKELP